MSNPYKEDTGHPAIGPSYLRLFFDQTRPGWEDEVVFDGDEETTMPELLKREESARQVEGLRQAAARGIAEGLK